MSDRPTLTRRGLFRSVAATSAATAVLGCKPGTSAPPAGEVTPEVGPGPSPVRFTLNGAETTLDVPPHTTLLSALRNHLDHTGPKEVCDRGACGACMVEVDGVIRNSCMMLAHDVAGRQVTTIEGLAGDETLTALQQAFVEKDALQCGFCTSGMIMSSRALLEGSGGGALTPEQVRHGLAGNLCRCGTYPHVVDAVVSVSRVRGTRKGSGA